MNRRKEPGQPKKKRMRLGEGVGEEMEVPKDDKNMTTTPKKRKVGLTEERQNKRARKIPNIRRYITCRKWKEAGEEMTTPEESPVKGEQTGHYLDRAEKERDTLK